MGVNYFNEEQIRELLDNPYVERVSPKAITYSEEFKEHFMFERNAGKLPAEIFREAGFDTRALGKMRIDSFNKRVHSMNERPEGFKDLRSENSGRVQHKKRTLEEENAYLRHQVALQKQQIEALKKTNAIKRKAARASRKKNTD